MPLARPDAVNHVIAALDALNSERPSDDQIPLTEHTALLGEGSSLDSLDFVAFVSDLEERLEGDTGGEFILVSELEASMAEGRHPFRSVAALADRIVEMAVESDEG